MYIVTFYSYKGGVGRTMALVNVAYQLAAAGKRVLAVDFDLEAPGLSSYGPFRCAGDHAGIVEYVHAYLDSGEAPDVADYIMRCKAGDHRLWLMPAGRHRAPSYAANYSALNWQELYRDHEGFLLFEDLRQQWALFEDRGFDYVLIDSRTGHTDIGGICTRQLPNAVVIQFLPTDQNVEGLLPIVDGIRNEGTPVRKEQVRMVFCPSNLPDGDDQELILKKALERAQKTLDYKQTAVEIYHYGALDLLEQPIYSATHPNSRLAGEYRRLHHAIISYNFEDRDGAIIALERMTAEYQSALTGGGDRLQDEKKTRADAALIAATFPQDVEVNWRLAILAGQMGRPEDELTALNVVVEASRDGVSFALLMRARALASMDHSQNAIADLERLLTSEPVNGFEVSAASDLLRRLSPVDWLRVLKAAVLNPQIPPADRSRLLQEQMTDRDRMPAVLGLIRESAALSNDQSGELRTTLSLAKIADGRFAEAMSDLAPDREALLTRGSMPDIFNYAICEWAVTGAPPVDLFAQVLAKRTRTNSYPDVNGLQCFALCSYVVGRTGEALEGLQMAQLTASRSTSLAFSGWRYLTVPAKSMLEDLDEMHALFARNAVLRAPSRGGLKEANA